MTAPLDPRPLSQERSAHVLVVDDHDGVCETVGMLIERLGHHAHGVRSGAEALEILAVGGVDLVVTDLRLPDFDGIELLRRMKEQSPLTPVILLTGYPTLDAAIQAIKLGASDFLPKPFRLEALERAITKALEDRRLVVENQRLLAEANKVAVIQRLNARLNAKVNELTALNRISEAINGVEDNEQLFQRVVDLAAEVTGAARVSVMVVSADGQSLTIRAARGLSDRVVAESRVALGSGVAGQVALSRTALFVTRADGLAGPSEHPSVYTGASFISVPLVISGEVLGVLNVSEKVGGGDFTEDEFRLMQALGEKAAIKFENNALYESIYCNLVDTLRSLVTTLEAKDPYTKEHSKRVTRTAVALARVMGLGDQDIESLQFAGILHDIGKIGVRDSILFKPGRLTATEFEVIKMHPIVGAQIVEPLGLVEAERGIIRHHHERWDGCGYPDGLRGEEIPLLARLVGVADALDAMTTTRPYRHAMSIEEALGEFDRCRGTQFDPRVVDALHEVLAVETGPQASRVRGH